ncbi:MAG: cysteine synthase A [Oscillospiraceae bacterium]|nr:cysteine synthase A [Oscillospiraceae bacterium]
MHVFSSLADMIGSTPMLQPRRYSQTCGLRSTLLLKLERCNPAGSAKDRVALQMILDAEEKGLLHPGATIIEPTSGNTGIGLAAVGISRGYRVILTMPDSMSVERRALLAAYGAELVLTAGALGMSGAIAKAEELAAAIPGSWLAGQFDNPSNPRAHYLTTGPEIWRDADGRVDIFVAGVGTGGTLSGAGRYLKEQNPRITLVAVEPAASPLLTEGHAGSHGLQGIGANFIPKNLDRQLIDGIIPVTEADAYDAARLFARTEGLLCGITSGAALHAATILGRRPENAEKTIVALLPDSGERYLSTPLFAE